MGIVISYLRSVVAALRALLAEIVASNAAFKPVLERIRASPGLPVPNPTTPFWAQNPPFPALVNIGGNTRFFADEAEDGRVLDVVIIGSGMTGAGAAWGLLKGNAKGGSSAALCPMPRVLMLEARSICSGATGRNGGHIKGEPYDSFHNLRQKYGVDRAREILRFRRGHVNILAGLQEATLPEFEKAEIRKVETLDLFTEKETWEEAKERVELLRRVEEMDDIAGKVGVWEGEEMRKVCSSVVCAAASVKVTDRFLTVTIRDSTSANISLVRSPLRQVQCGHIAMSPVSSLTCSQIIKIISRSKQTHQ
jgi:hypothetical protein